MTSLKPLQSGERHDAETTPLSKSEAYQYDFDLPIAEVWRRGSVIASWLLHGRCTRRGQAGSFAPGESRIRRGALDARSREINEGVPASSAALFRDSHRAARRTFKNHLLSAMRAEFGGHAEKPASLMSAETAQRRSRRVAECRGAGGGAAAELVVVAAARAIEADDRFVPRPAFGRVQRRGAPSKCSRASPWCRGYNGRACTSCGATSAAADRRGKATTTWR